MGCHGEKRENQRLINSDIYKYVAKNSTLTANQVKECFDVYYKIILGLIENEYKSPDMEIFLPHLGVFYFTKKQGHKKGKKFKLPNLTNGGKDVIIIEEDEPDYEQLRFRVHRRLKEKNKKLTRKKYIKDGQIQKK